MTINNKVGVSFRHRQRIQNRWDKLIYWYTFFMAFPAIVILQNVSIYIFIAISLMLIQYKKNLFDLRQPIQWIALLFGVGSILSAINIPDHFSIENTWRSLAVLPNYLYWALLIMVLCTNREKININHTYKAIFWGVILSIIYFFILQRIGVRIIPIFKKYSQNIFAFVLICFSPIASYYVLKKYGFKQAVIFLLLITLSGFLSGSRSGSLLAMSGSFFSIVLPQFKLKHVIILLSFFSIIAIGLFSTKPVQNVIFQLNPRTHDLIYNRSSVLINDRSYLTRVAMIQKGIKLFKQYPLSGVGINNFTYTSVQLTNSFKGAEYVTSKAEINEMSAHNSYIGILAEGGLLSFIPFVLLLIINILYFIFRYNHIPESYKPFYISVLFMSIHLYFIMAIVNVFAWFIIGLASALIYRKH